MRLRAAVPMCVAIVLAGCDSAGERQPAPGPESGETANGGGGRETARARTAQTSAEADPSDPAGWAAAIRAWIMAAAAGDRLDPSTGEYSEEGEELLRRAVAAWEQYLALDDRDRDRSSMVASRMVRVFVALDNLAQASGAQETVAVNRQTHGAYAQLAVLAYQAGLTRKGDLAAARAVELAPRDEREPLAGQLDAAKKQAALLRG